MTGICNSVLPKRRYFTGEKLRGGTENGKRENDLGCEERDELLREKNQQQQPGAGNQAHQTWRRSIHKFEIGRRGAGLKPTFPIDHCLRLLNQFQVQRIPVHHAVVRFDASNHSEDDGSVMCEDQNGNEQPAKAKENAGNGHRSTDAKVDEHRELEVERFLAVFVHERKFLALHLPDDERRYHCPKMREREFRPARSCDTTSPRSARHSDWAVSELVLLESESAFAAEA